MTEAPFGNLDFGAAGASPARVPDLGLSEDIPVAYRPDEIVREATRYLVFVGDVLTPRQKRERADLRLGGEYYGQQYPCLVRSKYLLRRCQLTPLEIGYDFINDELMGDNPNKLLVSSSLQTDDGKQVVNLGGKLNAVAMYPGDQIKGILIGDRNQDAAKGVLEVKTLAGVDYPDFKDSCIQEFVFPEWKQILAGLKNFPTKLSELERHFDARKKETSDANLKEVVDTYSDSAAQFREWGTRYLKYASMLVRQPAHQGFVHVYPDLAEQLFDVLEVRREDMLTADAGLAEILAKASAGNSVSGPDVLALIGKMTELQEQMLAFTMNGGFPRGTAQVEQEKLEQPEQCTAITSSGAQCKNNAVANGRCTVKEHQI